MAFSAKSSRDHSRPDVGDQAQRHRQQENAGPEPRIRTRISVAGLQDKKDSASNQQDRQPHDYEVREQGPEDHVNLAKL